MYTCPLHQWFSISNPCPSCVRTIPSTSTNYFIINPTPEVGKTMEEILEKAANERLFDNLSNGNQIVTLRIAKILQAMSEWASLQCESKDAEIKELREKLEKSEHTNNYYDSIKIGKQA